MKQMHGGFIGCNPDRMMARSNGVPFAYGDKFPMSDPFQALLSLIYANAQKDELGKDVVEGIIEPKAEEVAGKGLVEDIKEFIDSVSKGSKEFIDSEAGKKITVTVDDYSEAAEHIVNPGKEASIADYKFTKNPFHEFAIRELQKKACKVKTSFPKLAYLLGAFKLSYPEVTSVINLLKHSMINDGVLTTSNKEAQRALIEKLSDIFKGPDGKVDEELIRKLVYNTDISEDSENIIHIKGYPIDVNKVKSLSYDEAKKALTETLADIIFNDEKTEVDIEKFKDFLEDIVERQDTESEKEEVADRIVDPILLAFQKVDDESGDMSYEAFANAVKEKYGYDVGDFGTHTGSGLAKGKRIIDFNLKELLAGMEIEKEHTPDIRERLQISMDHLTEKPNSYYTLLKEYVEGNKEEKSACSMKPFKTAGLDKVIEKIGLKKLSGITNILLDHFSPEEETYNRAGIDSRDLI